LFDFIEKTGLYLEKNESKILFAALTSTALAAMRELLSIISLSSIQ
jgi:hypothetical protein